MLGPAKLIQEKQSDRQLEQGPLGSIALEPQYISTVLSNGSEFVTNEYQSSEELSLVSDGHQVTPEHQIFGNGKVINGTQVDTEMNRHREQKDAGMLEVVELEQNAAADEFGEDQDLVSDGNYASPEPMNGSLVDVRIKESNEVKNEESHEPTQKELQVNEASEVQSVKEESTATRSKVTPIAGDVKVETFPMRPVTRTNDLDGINEAKDMANAFSEQGTEKVELVTGVASSLTDGINSSQDKKGVTEISDLLLDKLSVLVDGEVVEEQLDPLLESSNCSNGGARREIQDSTDIETKVSSNALTSVTSEQTVAIPGAKVSYGRDVYFISGVSKNVLCYCYFNH